MTCKCGYQNQDDAKYCGGCGRKLRQDGGISKKVLAIMAVCLLVIGIGIGTVLPELGDILPQKAPREIAQVLPVEDGSVAVRYTDGTVRVSDNSPFCGMVSGWCDVEKLYYFKTIGLMNGEIRDFPVLRALTKDGSVLSTDGSLSAWSNVKELHFDWQGVVGVTRDGRVLAEGDWEDISFLTNLTDVEHLVYGDIQGIWGCLRKNGNVTLHGDGVDPDKIRWRNVKELRSSGHAFYVIKNDGTVDGGVEDDQSGLNGAVKVVDCDDWLFGISADGRLLTHNGGNIYTNTGDMMVAEPGLSYYRGEIDISRFYQVKDIVPFGSLILLNEDGTVQFLGAYREWDFRDWNDIQKVYGVWDKEWIVESLYGIRKDGSVIVNRYDQSTSRYTVTDGYQGWKLKALYCTDGGVIGVTTDGRLVGDGIFEAVDFSVFDR